MPDAGPGEHVAAPDGETPGLDHGEDMGGGVVDLSVVAEDMPAPRLGDDLGRRVPQPGARPVRGGLDGRRRPRPPARPGPRPCRCGWRCRRTAAARGASGRGARRGVWPRRAARWRRSRPWRSPARRVGPRSKRASRQWSSGKASSAITRRPISRRSPAASSRSRRLLSRARLPLASASPTRSVDRPSASSAASSWAVASRVWKAATVAVQRGSPSAAMADGSLIRSHAREPLQRRGANAFEPGGTQVELPDRFEPVEVAEDLGRGPLRWDRARRVQGGERGCVALVEQPGDARAPVVAETGDEVPPRPGPRTLTDGSRPGARGSWRPAGAPCRR